MDREMDIKKEVGYTVNMPIEKIEEAISCFLCDTLGLEAVPDKVNFIWDIDEHWKDVKGVNVTLITETE